MSNSPLFTRCITDLAQSHGKIRLGHLLVITLPTIDNAQNFRKGNLHEKRQNINLQPWRMGLLKFELRRACLFFSLSSWFCSMSFYTFGRGHSHNFLFSVSIAKFLILKCFPKWGQFYQGCPSPGTVAPTRPPLYPTGPGRWLEASWGKGTSIPYPNSPYGSVWASVI